MNDIGDKFIDGRIVNLDKEPLENLEKMAKSISEREESMKFDLDGIMNEMIQS